MTVDVVALGISTLDISVNHFDPKWLEADNTPMDGIASFAGGDATNQAIILNKLGKSVRRNTLVGKDDMGDILMARMKSSGLNLASVKRKDGISTSVSLVFVKENGERSIITQHGNNGEMTEAELDYGQIRHCRALSIGSIYGNIKLEPDGIKKALFTAKDSGALTFADLANDKRGDRLRGIMPYLHMIDYFMPSYNQAKLITGETDPNRIIYEFKKIGCNTVILKKNTSGVLLESAPYCGWIDAYPVPDVVDSTGAGDAFCACFISATLDGMDAELAARYAVVGAALNCQHFGASTAPLTDDLIRNEIFKQRKKSL